MGAHIDIDEPTPGQWGPIRAMLDATEFGRDRIDLCVFELEFGRSATIKLTHEQAKQLGQWLSALS